MKHLILGAATTAVLGVGAAVASADYGYGGRHGPRGGLSHYSHQHQYYQDRHRSYRGWTYGHRGGYGYRGGYGWRANSFSEAAREIRAAHSRYRFNTHPRSYHNSPPYRYRPWGW